MVMERPSTCQCTLAGHVRKLDKENFKHKIMADTLDNSLIQGVAGLNPTQGSSLFSWVSLICYSLDALLLSG